MDVQCFSAFFVVLPVTIPPKSRRVLGVFAAYFRKIDDKWRAEVERDGVRASKRFATKKEAELWAAEQEMLIARNSGKVVYDKTVAETIDRYVRDVSANKVTARQERTRLNAFLRDFPVLSKKLLFLGGEQGAAGQGLGQENGLDVGVPRYELQELRQCVCRVPGRVGSGGRVQREQ